MQVDLTKLSTTELLDIITTKVTSKDFSVEDELNECRKRIELNIKDFEEKVNEFYANKVR